MVVVEEEVDLRECGVMTQGHPSHSRTLRPAQSLTQLFFSLFEGLDRRGGGGPWHLKWGWDGMAQPGASFGCVSQSVILNHPERMPQK